MLLLTIHLCGAKKTNLPPTLSLSLAILNNMDIAPHTAVEEEDDAVVLVLSLALSISMSASVLSERMVRTFSAISYGGSVTIASNRSRSVYPIEPEPELELDSCSKRIKRKERLKELFEVAHQAT